MDFFGWLFVFCFVMFCIARAEARARLKAAYQFEPENTLAGARFADNKDLKRAGAFAGKGIRVGWSPDGKRPIYYKGSGHLLSVACARGGKGVSLLIPALLLWALSAVVVDPKAELLAVSGYGRRRFGCVYALDPFGLAASLGVNGVRFVGFNPLRDINPASPEFHSECDKVAGACVWEENGNGYHFSVAARLLVSGVIAGVVRHGKDDKRKNLAEVARIISGPKFLEFCREIVSNTNDPDIIAKLGRFAKDGAEKNEEIRDVIATAITQLGFISGAIAKHLSGGAEWNWRDLKRKPGTTVYVCVPLNRLDVCGDKYFRLVVETLMSALLGENPRGKQSRVLMMIDEFAQLGGRMKSIENAMGMAAGAAGLQLWLVLQDISQLIGMFPQTWSTVIQNCGVTTWFGARDHQTRTVMADLAGVSEVISRSRNVSRDPKNGTHYSDSMSQYARPLLHPYECGQLPDDSMLLFMEGVKGPVLAKRKVYFKCGEFNGRYRDNPYAPKKHGGGLGWLFG